jgi:hypothetical protein
MCCAYAFAASKLLWSRSTVLVPILLREGEHRAATAPLLCIDVPLLFFCFVTMNNPLVMKDWKVLCWNIRGINAVG